MLERYFVRAETVARIRSSWIGKEIDRYVGWLTERRYAAANIYTRVPILEHFGEFARRRGANAVEELPAHVEAFAEHWASCRKRRVRTERRRREAAQQVRCVVGQMLRATWPDSSAPDPPTAREPFWERAPGFFTYLREERGVRDCTIQLYRYHLRALESYLGRDGGRDLGELSHEKLGAFVIKQSRSLGKGNLKGRCLALRVFLRYLHREGILARDLGGGVESPLVYRLSSVPRSITREEVAKLLGSVDRGSPVGRRDYAVLLLLLTYGLRAREVAELKLDDIDWRRERLRVPARKAGHSSAYPLSPAVGAALLEYLGKDRPPTRDRRVFFCVCAPFRPLKHNNVSELASRRLRRAGVAARRAGSHTLRHTCVQRLVDAGFPLKQVGDYVGHRTSASTEIYSKVSIEALREVACGDGEAIL